MSVSTAIGMLALGLALGVGVPALIVSMMAPSLAASEKARTVNFRGRPVFYGLGIVWLVWAGGAIIAGVAAANVFEVSSVEVLSLAGVLALVAFAMGAVDDAYGSSDSRGFKGHLKAVADGRLTTGGLKLLGIGSASLVVGVIMGEVAPWDTTAPAALGAASTAISALMAGASIALTSNFVNLMDLRPGRALKVYSALGIAGAASVAFAFGASALDVVRQAGEAQRLLDFAIVLAFVLGPVVATWRFDLGERAMLGDAGANPMGAVAGLFVIAGLPFWGLLAYTVVIFALNLVSERVSFSAVIERNRALAWLDGLGRLAPADAPAHARGEQEADSE